MLPTREGRYRAEIAEVGISEKNNKCQVALRFKLLAEFTADGWAPRESENLEIIGYFFLTKEDGSLNNFTVKNFKEVLMWNGVKIAHILTAKEATVQVTLAHDEYNGQTRMKVKYMNPFDWDGAGVTNDTSAIDKFERALGSKLRANAGGTSVPAIKSTPPPIKNAEAESGFPFENSTEDEVWGRLVAKFPDLPAESQGTMWTDVLNRVFPGITDTKALTPRQWGMVMEEIEKPDFKAAV